MNAKRSFIEKLVEKRPDIRRRTVYFCTKSKSLACFIRGNGTVSPVCSPNKEFKSASDLIKAFAVGELSTQEFTVGRGVAKMKLNFSDDLYFFADRSYSLGKFYAKPVLTPFLTPANMKIRLPCDGFEVRSVPASTIRQLDISCISILENGYCRSKACSGELPRRKKSIICEKCHAARNVLSVRVSRLRKRKLLCPGIPPIGLDSAARKCGTLISGRKRRCGECQSVYEQESWKDKQRIADDEDKEEQRLLHSAVKYLDADDKAKKTLIMANRHRGRLVALKKNMRKMAKRAKRELAKHKPADEANQAAVASVTKFLNVESEKQNNKNCYWLEEDGESQCMFVGETGKGLLKHLNDVHLRQQVVVNQPVPPLDRKYYCRWNGCKRRAPVWRRELLYHHFKLHVPSAKAKRRLKVLNEQLQNCSREATARRYSAETKSMAMENYQSQGSWKRTRQMSVLPLPSVGTMTREKNRGDVATPRIDHHVVEQLGKLIQAQPNFKHGILAFDEIYVAGTVDFNKADDCFGYAEKGNTKGVVANAVWVFQFVPLFAYNEFRVDVAWFPVKTCDADWLLMWLYKVLFVMRYYAKATITALVCDGSSVNRKLQKKLLSLADRDDGSFCYPPGVSDGWIYILNDPSHAIKKLRKCFYANGMMRNGNLIDFNYIHRVYDWQQQQPSRLDRQLTEKHLCLDSANCMNVQTAIDIFSEAIESAVDHVDSEHKSSETQLSMSMCRSFWLAVNHGQVITSLFGAEKSIFEPLAQVEGYLRDWQREASQMKEPFLMKECFEDTMAICERWPSYIRYLFGECDTQKEIVRFRPRKVTQDFLECDFGILRQSAGGSRNPPLKSLVYSLRRINENRLSKALSTDDN